MVQTYFLAGAFLAGAAFGAVALAGAAFLAAGAAAAPPAALVEFFMSCTSLRMRPASFFKSCMPLRTRVPAAELFLSYYLSKSSSSERMRSFSLLNGFIGLGIGVKKK